jgi:polysaccharide chain length determinant protein (PEP-CTERM system associated)
MNIDFKYYLGVFWRRLPYFLVAVALFTSVGLSIAVILPPEYEARATLLIESPQIPDELAASTVRTNPEEQLQIIEQRLLTRANLLDTANRLNVYGNDRSEMPSASGIVQDMRDRTALRSSTGRNEATLMSIGFRADTAQLAAEVANEFVTLVLQENIAMRTNRAGETLEFFEQEVERLGNELDVQSTRILDFQTQNAGALPSGADFLRDQRTDASDRIGDITREQTSLRDQRERLVDIFERTGALSGASVQRSPAEQALFEAQQQLDEAMLVYSEGNPRVKFLESRVEMLKGRVSSAPSQDAAPSTDSPTATLMNAQLAEIDSRMLALETERTALEEDVAEFDGFLAQIPANAITLEKLQRDYDNLREQYNRAIGRLGAAETGERIELLAKGERITVIEQATAPDSPTKPNRPLIAAAGAGAGVAAGFALIFLLELLNRSIRRPVELTDRLGVTPLAVLPYIRTEREAVTKRLVVLGLIGFLLIVFPVTLFYVHTALYPLDGLIEPIANRLGFSVSN